MNDELPKVTRRLVKAPSATACGRRTWCSTEQRGDDDGGAGVGVGSVAGGEEDAGARKVAEAEGEQVVPGDGPDHVEAKPSMSRLAHFLVRGGDGAGAGDKRRHVAGVSVRA